MKNFVCIAIGVCIGVILYVLGGIYKIRKEGGLPLVGAKVLGDVRIVPSKVDQKMLPGVKKCVFIQKDGENMIALFFGQEKKLHNVSFYNNEKVLFSAEVGEAIASTDYHGKDGSMYLDKNADGIYDAYFYNDDKLIFLNGEWSKVEGIKGDVAEVGEMVYEFSVDGWVQK